MKYKYLVSCTYSSVWFRFFTKTLLSLKKQTRACTREINSEACDIFFQHFRTRKATKKKHLRDCIVFPLLKYFPSTLFILLLISSISARLPDLLFIAVSELTFFGIVTLEDRKLCRLDRNSTEWKKSSQGSERNGDLRVGFS